MGGRDMRRNRILQNRKNPCLVGYVAGGVLFGALALFLLVTGIQQVMTFLGGS